MRVYSLQALAKQRGGELNASNTIYVKVVPSTEAAIVEGVPKLEKKCRVLLIGLKMFSESLAQHLRQLGADVDVMDESCTGSTDSRNCERRSH